MRHSSRALAPALLPLTLLPVILVGACMPDETTPADDAAAARTDAWRDAATDSRTAAASPQDQFLANLAELCGEAYQGEIVASSPEGADDDFAGQDMVMHVRECEDDVIRIPFHVGEDRSRTWIITRTADGLRLKHDHRHEDGSPDEITMYGGETGDEGSATRQRFLADQATADMLPAAAMNVWTVTVAPGETFGYELRREGTVREFRVEVDLTNPVEAPPAPWGWD